MNKAIITVVGKDNVGIISKVSSYLAKENISVMDITQTITGGYFNMMMIVDIENAKKNIDDISDDFEKIGKSISVIIKIQLEDIFTSMHRI